MGADIVGIGSIDRWSTAPIQMDPKQIMPNAKSVIAMGFRVLRGSLRGVEEGTYFSNYSAMGYGGITYLYMPMTVINLSKMIEDAGYESMIYFGRNHSMDMMKLEELTDYPFWLAMYSTVMDYPYKVHMWQYTDQGSVPGISGNVDMNLWLTYE